MPDPPPGEGAFQGAGLGAVVEVSPGPRLALDEEGQRGDFGQDLVALLLVWLEGGPRVRAVGALGGCDRERMDVVLERKEYFPLRARDRPFQLVEAL